MGANGGKGKKAKGKPLDWANLNLIFLFFYFLLCFQKYIIYIQVSIMKIEQKSDLKNKLQGLNKLEFYFFSHFW